MTEQRAGVAVADTETSRQERDGMKTTTPPRTRLTKAGNPTMGTVIELHVSPPGEPDGEKRWERCTVVGKGHGGHANELRAICVEWCDGARQWVPFIDLIWRALA